MVNEALIRLQRQVRERADIVDIVISFSPELYLEPKTREELTEFGDLPLKEYWLGFCPFHKDRSEYPVKTFLVSNETGYYKCLDPKCGVLGDIFDFIEHKLDLSREEATKTLATRLGISISSIDLEQVLMPKSESEIVYEREDREYEPGDEPAPLFEHEKLGMEPNLFVNPQNRFICQLLALRGHYEEQFPKFFSSYERNRLTNPEVKAIFEYLSSNPKEHLPYLGTELLGRSAFDSVIAAIQAKSPDIELDKETLEEILIASFSLPTPYMSSLERSFAQIRQGKVIKKVKDRVQDYLKENKFTEAEELMDILERLVEDKDETQN